MSEKYIRVEDAIHMLESTGTLCGFGKYLLENPPSYCPTYTPADILAGQWVPVSERLPENDNSVLGWSAPLGDLTITERDDFASDCITHWFPFSEPPKEDNHGPD